jgi:hypothetical protein
MKTIAAIIRPLEKALNNLGICTTVGFMAGVITGFLLFCYWLTNPTPAPLTPEEFWIGAGMLWLFCFITILFILVVFCRFTLASVFFQTLLNTLLSSILTTYVVTKWGLWEWAFLVGLVIGLVVGRLLCFICQTLKRK